MTNEEDNKRIDLFIFNKKKNDNEHSKIMNAKYRIKRKEWRLNHPFQNLSKMNNKKGINITAWDLWKMAKKQKMKCPYSGRPLIKGYIHLDHIIPKYKGGSDNINNLQLLPAEVNLSKGRLIPSDFITLCRDITNYYKL